MIAQDLERRSVAPSLAGAEWLKRPGTLAVLAALNGDGVETRAVGGAVRNALLGLPVTEIDLATTAEPDRVIALAERAGLKTVPTGIDHGTVTVIVEGKPFEVTTLRRDVETFGRHAKVAYTTSWEEDAKRRDFTLNALYADRDGNVFDPIGGYGDLQAGRVRFIGEAEARIKEDYLRILRFFRFHAYYGKGAMDEEGLQAAVRLRAGLEQLSAERVAGEMRRILVAPGAIGAVEALFDHGLLTTVLGGVPRLVRFERLVAIEEANGLAPNSALQARGACGLRGRGCRQARRSPAAVQRRAGRACARRARRRRGAAGRGSGQGCYSIASVLTPTARASCSPGPTQAHVPRMQRGATRLRFPSDGRRRSFRSAATM